MFKGRKLIIATKHNKEHVIAPILEEQLMVTCFISDTLDTDTLGTFSGEVEREDDPLTTLKKKCEMAMQLSHCDLGVANEGSFGAHPAIPFGSADEELVILIDKKNNLEIVAKTISVNTNFNGSTIRNERELLEFADRVTFPSHGLILRPKKDHPEGIIKGITDLTTLKTEFRNIIDYYGQAFVETDMRAMYNPTRMLIIEEATKKLVEKIQSTCPKCNIPGFDVSEVKKGLPCGLCNFPTASTLSLIFTCKHCSYSEEKPYPNNKTEEDPMYCDMCNP